MKKKLVVFFFIGFLIRLISLNQSLWLDEATTARVLKEYGFAEIVSEFSPTDFHPPLYYLFMKIWSNVFGYSEIALRLPSVIFSLLTGWFVYLIGKNIANNDSGQAGMTRKSIGFWAAAFYLFNPLIVYYSQEARMYTMVTFFLTATLYFLTKACHAELGSASELKNRSRNPFDKFKPSALRLLRLEEILSVSKDKFGMTKAVIMFNLFSSLSFLTFYGSIFLIIPMGIYLFYKKKYRNFFVFLLLFTVTILLLSPLLSQQFVNAKQQLKLVVNWGQVLGKANLKNLVLIPVKFSIGRISFYPKWVYWGVSGLWTSLILFFTLKGGLKNKVLLFLIVNSLGLGILFSFFTPLLQFFRFLYLIPIISIMLAIGTAKFHRFAGKWLVLAGYLLLSAVYLLNPNFHREDWRSLAEAQPKNKPIYMVYSSSDPIRYYRNDIKIFELKSISDAKLVDSEITVIPYAVDIHGIDYQKILSEKKYKLIQQSIFRGLVVEKWKYYSN